MFFDYKALKNYMDEKGVKQRNLAMKLEMSEATLCKILRGQRKCEVGEYASICEILEIDLRKFLKRESTSHTTT